MVLAGYGKVGMWVSSSAADMDIYVSVRAVDEDGREVDYIEFSQRWALATGRLR